MTVSFNGGQNTESQVEMILHCKSLDFDQQRFTTVSTLARVEIYVQDIISERKCIATLQNVTHINRHLR